MEKVSLKRDLKVIYPEDIATIAKHRDNMMELEKTEHGEAVGLIQMEIFDCRRFLNNAKRNMPAAQKRLKKIKKK